jgi:hypothetical protein
LRLWSGPTAASLAKLLWSSRPGARPGGRPLIGYVEVLTFLTLADLFECAVLGESVQLTNGTFERGNLPEQCASIRSEHPFV